MTGRIEPVAGDRARARAWASAFVAVFETLDRAVGFTLLPVVVPDEAVALALVAALNDRGIATTAFAPRRASDWDEFVSHLLDRAAPLTTTVVVTTGASDTTREGLWLVNRQREAYLHTHNRPLLWCVDPEALRLCSEEAPDFWSIRATPKHVRPPAVADLPALSAAIDPRSLEALLALVDDGTCTDGHTWSALSGALETQSLLHDAAYCAESAALFSDATEKASALDRAMRLRVVIAAQSEDGEWARRFASAPSRSDVEHALSLRQFSGPVARAVVAIVAREAHAGRSSAAWFTEQRVDEWLADDRVGHRSLANALGVVASSRMHAMKYDAAREETLHVRFERDRDAQRLLLDRLRASLPKVEPTAVEAVQKWEPHFIEALFAISYARLGRVASTDALDAAVAANSEEAELGSPNALLLALLRAREDFDAHERGDWAEWYAEVLRRERVERVRNRAELLAKRTRWIAAAAQSELRPSWQSASIEDQLRTILETPTTAAAKLRELLDNVMFDHERVDAIQRVARAVLSSRDVNVVAASVDELIDCIDAVIILGHRASAIGAIASLIVDSSQRAALQKLMLATKRMTELSRESMLSLRDLILAVQPVVLAASRIEAYAELGVFTQQFDAQVRSNSRDALRLRAVLASALCFSNADRAAEQLHAVLNANESQVEINGRYDVVYEVLDAARGLSLDLREELLLELLSRYQSYRDNFTTQRFYRTHALLVVEGVLDAAIAPTPAMLRFAERSVRTSRAFLARRR